ncbi:MAG: hypothetical protein WC551_11935 [Patescibacteria group bacterium]
MNQKRFEELKALLISAKEKPWSFGGFTVAMIEECAAALEAAWARIAELESRLPVEERFGE